MNPAICYLCGKSAIDEKVDNKGDWIEFMDYKEADAESLIHPQGLEYFCAEHFFAAFQLKEKSSDIALKELETLFPQKKPVQSPKASWLQRLIRR